MNHVRTYAPYIQLTQFKDGLRLRLLPSDLVRNTNCYEELSLKPTGFLFPFPLPPLAHCYRGRGESDILCVINGTVSQEKYKVTVVGSVSAYM